MLSLINLLETALEARTRKNVKILTLEKMALVAEKQNIVKVNAKKLTEEKTNVKKCC